MKNLLVMRLSAMGDVVMTVPVIDSFLRTYPDVHITMLSNPRLQPLFSGLNNLTFVPVDTKKQYAGWLGMYRLYKDLKREHSFDAMIDLHDVLRSKILRTLFRISGLPTFVIDKGRKEKKALVANSKGKVQLKSSVQRYADVFRQAGYPFEVQNLPYHSQVEGSAELNDLLNSKSGSQKWIGIAPFAQHKGKIYPIEKTEKVIAHFSQQSGTTLLLFGGGPEEKSQLEAWAEKYPQTKSLAGKFRLEEELLLLKKCDVALTMDSANMHLASLVGTPVVSVWGATHPYAGFYGLGQKEDNAVQLDMSCRPCSIYGNKPCSQGDYPCLRNIDESLIIQKIDKILAQ